MMTKQVAKLLKKYREQHLLSEEQVFTLAKLDTRLAGKTFEALYSQEVIALANPAGASPTKGQFSLLFQRLRLEGDYRVGMGTTTNRLKAILTKIQAAVESVPEPKTKPSKGSARPKKSTKKQSKR